MNVIKELEESIKNLDKKRDEIRQAIKIEQENVLVQALKNIETKIATLKSNGIEPKCVIMSYQLDDYLTRFRFFMPSYPNMPRLYKYKGLKVMTDVQLEPDEFYIGV